MNVIKCATFRVVPSTVKEGKLSLRPIEVTLYGHSTRDAIKGGGFVEGDRAILLDWDTYQNLMAGRYD